MLDRYIVDFLNEDGETVWQVVGLYTRTYFFGTRQEAEDFVTQALASGQNPINS